MKRKLLTVLLTLIAVLCLCIGLVACDLGGSGNAGNGSDTEQSGTTKPDDGGTTKPDEHVHSFTNYVYNNDATCTEDGTETATCTCGVSDTRTKSDSALGHTFETYIPNGDATCLENGTETAQCIRCLETDTREDEESALGHDFLVYSPFGNATCTKNATQIAKCSRCNVRNIREIENTALGHEMEVVTAQEPTCNDIGWDEYQECSRCHIKENYTPIAALGHKFEDYFPNGDATCLENGTETAQCIRCPETDTREDDDSALGHNFQIQHEAKEATCSEAGYRAYQECDRCHVLTLSEEDLIPAQHIQYELTDEGYAISGVSVDCLDKDIFISETYMGKPVISINSQAFKDCTWITNFSLPSSLISIDNSAFYGCTALKSVTFGENSKLTTIGASAFYGCTALQRVTFGEKSKLATIGSSAFNNCALTSIEIPDSVTSIGSSAFDGCSSLESVTFGENGKLYSIEQAVFYNCKALTSIRIPDSVTIIDYKAFYGCRSLQEAIVTDKSQLASIERNAFEDCSALKRFTIPSTVTYIEGINSYDFYDAFYNCSSLESISVDENNPSYSSQDGILYNKAKNRFVHIPKAIKGAVTIPDSMTSIGSSAFSGCSLLESITVEAGNPSYSSKDGILYNKAMTIFIHIPKALKGDVKISERITSIGNYAFSGCSGLTSIVIPDAVTSIGKSAFSGCNSLETMTIPFVGSMKEGSDKTFFGYIFGADYSSNNSRYVPDSLKKVIILGGTSIGEDAFSGCSGLISITIPNSVTSIGDSAFSGCSGLTGELKIPNGVTSIGDSAFKDCGGLTGVYIIDLLAWCRIDFKDYYSNPLYYAHHLYVDNVELKELTIPNEITEIKPYAFYNCSELISVEIPDSVTSIGKRAFYGCSELTGELKIPDSVISIGDSAFSGCSRIESISIPFVGGSKKTAKETYQYPFGFIFGTSYFNGSSEVSQRYYGGDTYYTTTEKYYVPDSLKHVTITGGGILYGAFSDCSGLTSITISDSVTSIEKSAFYGCNSLESVTIGNGVTSIGEYAFYHCNSLESIMIPDSVTSIVNYAFWGCSGLTSMEVAHGNPVYHSAGNCLIETESKTLIAGCKTSEIPSDGSVTSIGVGAFDGCSGLTNITIPDSVTEIEYGAFYGCSGLTSITIPGSVTSIGVGAFENCSSLESAIFANPKGWRPYYSTGAPITDLDLSDPVKAAIYLCETYDSYTWKRY